MTNAPSPWKVYEPQPPRCSAIVVTDANWDEVFEYFRSSYDSQLVAVTQHVDRDSGVKTLTLKFRTYEVLVKPYQVIRRSADDEGRYGVMDHRDFNKLWRERLSS